MRRIPLAALLICVVPALAAQCVSAAEPAPGWRVFSRAVPTHFSSKPALGFPDGYDIMVRNAGSVAAGCVKVAVGTGGYNDSNCSQPNRKERSGEGGFEPGGAPVTIEDVLPTHVEPTRVVGYDVGARMVERGLGQESIRFDNIPELKCESHKVAPGQFAVKCVDGAKIEPAAAFGVVPPGDTLYIAITVAVSPKVEEEGQSVSNLVKVSGGGAPPASIDQSTAVSGEPAPFGLESLATEASGLDGSLDTQAGDHPYEFTTTYFWNTDAQSGVTAASPEQPKDFVVNLPPGFVGNPQVVNKCPQYLARNEACPLSSQIGVARIYTGVAQHVVNRELGVSPIFNEVPDRGVAAQFVFSIGGLPTTLFATVSHDTNYAVRIVVKGIQQGVLNYSLLTGISTTFFGTPLTDPDIDNLSVGAANKSFLQNPVNCAAGPLSTSVAMDSWQHPASWLANGSPNLADPNWKTTPPQVVYPSMTGCDMLQFEPSIQLTPDTTQADEPVGLNVTVKVPQGPGAWPALVTPELKDATVTLPAGVSLSPSAADGLQACSDAQVAVESTEPDECPEASVLGTVRIKTPLLEEPLTGRVYLGAPECDPCDSTDAASGRMVRLFLVAQGSGVRIKKEGHVFLNPSTGQLTTRFEENPQEPFEELELNFKGGLRAGLATPQSCGTFTTTSDFVPWSSPVTPDSNPSFPFEISSDGTGGSCPATPPLTPSFSAGTSNPNAGQFSPFTLTFAREDREQDLSGIQVHMSPGLSGILTGVPLCGEPEAAQGTCPQASRIGTMTVAAGPGSHPFYTKGSLYLTGSYKGAPFGLSIVVPTKAGPFDLGNVVVRSQINVDVHTTALTVTSDPFPQVIAGIPLRLRTANVTIDRPNFIFNPTNCAQQQITATIAGAQGSQTQVSAPFAVSGCAGLHFGPTFKVSTSGKTSKANGASLDARVNFPQGAQSNIAYVKVDLPKQLPSRLTTLQKACTAIQFETNPAGCPAASVIGFVKAITPLLPVPLTGPAYFVSHGGEAFPSLVVVLQGYGVRVDLIAATFISKAGITSSTFKTVPDAPVSSFELYLPEGKFSALAANGNLCKQKLLMPTLFTAQDGAQFKQNTKIAVTGCPKAKKAEAKKARRARASRHAPTADKAGLGRSGR
jgi:hypothetical protein